MSSNSLPFPAALEYYRRKGCLAAGKALAHRRTVLSSVPPVSGARVIVDKNLMEHGESQRTSYPSVLWYDRLPEHALTKAT